MSILHSSVLPAFTLALIANIAAAEEQPVYESFRDIPIGTVFLSPAERSVLDRQRRNPVNHDPDRVNREAMAPVSRQQQAPAGYIISSSGESHRWVDGDFVRDGDDDDSTMRFPGDIEVTRHIANDKVDERGESIEAVDDSLDRDNTVDTLRPDVAGGELEHVDPGLVASE